MQLKSCCIATFVVLAITSNSHANANSVVSQSIDNSVGTSDAGSGNGGKNTMDIGDGETVKTKGSTLFQGTEYDPKKCLLQFNSVGCKEDENCGELNGYKLQCTKSGGTKRRCQCSQNEKKLCQNQTNPDIGGVAQFGDCSVQECAGTFGFISTSGEVKNCQEKLHCVKEIDTKATKPAKICHTCRSCIAQNDIAENELSAEKRFDCTKICPKEILKSINQRNKKNVGIGDELSSEEGSEDSSWLETSESGSTSPQEESSSAIMHRQTVFGLVGTLVVASISMALF
jgi:hypothetical protein